MFINNKDIEEVINVEKIFKEIDEMLENLYAEADEIVDKYKKGE